MSLWLASRFFLLIYLMGAIDILNSTALRFDVIFFSVIFSQRCRAFDIKKFPTTSLDGFLLQPKTIPQDKSRENMKTILLICWPFFCFLRKQNFRPMNFFFSSFIHADERVFNDVRKFNKTLRLFVFCLSFVFSFGGFSLLNLNRIWMKNVSEKSKQVKQCDDGAKRSATE